MVALRALIQAFRPLAHANIAPALWLGQAFAFANGTPWSWRMFWFATAFGVLDHAFIIFSNDWADHEADAHNETFNRFSGGSRVLPDQLLSVDTIARAAWCSLLLLIALTAWLVAREQRPYFGWITAAGALTVIAYSLPPIRAAYRGHGETLQGIGVGVVLPLAGFYLQAGHVDLSPLILLVGFGLGYAGNLTTSLPDYPNDRAFDKRSYAVRKGQYNARRDSMLWIATSALATLGSATAQRWWPQVLLSAVCLSILALNLRGLRDADATRRQACERFVWVNGAAITSVWIGWTLVLATQALASLG